eukprot:5129089-Pleurochrysis_carterae.AAC.1
MARQPRPSGQRAPRLRHSARASRAGCCAPRRVPRRVPRGVPRRVARDVSWRVPWRVSLHVRGCGAAARRVRRRCRVDA